MTGGIALRPAREDDAGWTHLLRNLPHIRDASLDQAVIPLADHLAWWSAALQSPTRHLYIIIYDADDIGVLRMDRAGEAAQVSIYTRPEVAGRGVGRQALEAAARLACEDLGLQRLTATIRPENIASQRAFAAAGFTQHECGWVRQLGN